ncbi:MAG TPA: ferritin family protein [Thermodesulfovibrionales bacterium]|nr:ferritin family protein [Thermodesulfovibrionales bacterium]
MERFSIREVLDQAIQTERLGYQFYTIMAETFRGDEGLARLFSTLASKEQRHEKTFSELADLIRDDEPANWEEAEQYLRAIVESEFFLGKNKSLPSLRQVKTAADAVNFALGFEKETLLYFYGIREAVREKEIVDEIINEERSHVMWLNNYKSSFEQ